MFVTLIVVFIVLIPVILSKSLGYRINELWDISSWTKTGGIYLHSSVNNAKIYLDDEFIESNGVLIRNTFVQDLIPDRTYKIVVQKEGLYDWRKTLSVYPGIVTEANVLMLPEEIELSAVFPYEDALGVGTTTPPRLISGVTSTTTNPGYAELVDLFAAEDTDAVGTTDTETSTTTEDIPDYFVSLGIKSLDTLDNLIISGDQAAWLSNGNVLINWTDSVKVPPYYYCLTPNDCRNQLIVDWEEDIQKFNLLPGRDDVLIVLVNDGIYAVEIDDRSDRNIQPVYLGANLKFEINENDEVVVLDNGVFYELGL